MFYRLALNENKLVSKSNSCYRQTHTESVDHTTWYWQQQIAQQTGRHFELAGFPYIVLLVHNHGTITEL